MAPKQSNTGLSVVLGKGQVVSKKELARRLLSDRENKQKNPLCEKSYQRSCWICSVQEKNY